MTDPSTDDSGRPRKHARIECPCTKCCGALVGKSTYYYHMQRERHAQAAKCNDDSRADTSADDDDVGCSDLDAEYDMTDPDESGLCMHARHH